MSGKENFCFNRYETFSRLLFRLFEKNCCPEGSTQWDKHGIEKFGSIESEIKRGIVFLKIFPWFYVKMNSKDNKKSSFWPKTS